MPVPVDWTDFEAAVTGLVNSVAPEILTIAGFALTIVAIAVVWRWIGKLLGRK